MTETPGLLEWGTLEFAGVVPDSQLTLPTHSSRNGGPLDVELARLSTPEGFDLVDVVEAGTTVPVIKREHVVVSKHPGGVALDPLPLVRDKQTGVHIMRVESEGWVLMGPNLPPDVDVKRIVHARRDMHMGYVQSERADPGSVSLISTVVVSEANPDTSAFVGFRQHDRTTGVLEWGVAFELNDRGEVSYASLHPATPTLRELDAADMSLEDPESYIKGFVLGRFFPKNDWETVRAERAKRLWDAAGERFGFDTRQPLHLGTVALDLSRNIAALDYDPIDAVRSAV